MSVDVIGSYDLDPLLKALGDLVGVEVAGDSELVMCALAQMAGSCMANLNASGADEDAVLNTFKSGIHQGVDEALIVTRDGFTA